jgi:hypothetical protein
VNAPAGLGNGHALDAVHPALKAEEAMGAFAFDMQYDFLDAPDS